MPEIATCVSISFFAFSALRIDIFLRLFSLCLRTGYRLLKIFIIILAIGQYVALVRSPILSAYRTRKTYAAQMVGYVRTPPHFRCITVRTDSMLIKFV